MRNGDIKILEISRLLTYHFKVVGMSKYIQYTFSEGFLTDTENKGLTCSMENVKRNVRKISVR